MPSDSTIHALAGSAGGIVAMIATFPLVYVSTNAAVDSGKERKSAFKVVLDTIKHEGITGLYSGMGSSLLGIAVTNGVYYYFYERSRATILNSRPGTKALSTIESMLAGFIAGSATTVASNPLWVIQTTQTTSARSSPSGKSDNVTTGISPPPPPPPSSRRLGFLQTLQLILKTGGVGALWRGLGPALVLVVNPVLQYTVFEQMKNALVRRRTAALRATRKNGAVSGIVAVLSDVDYFILGALAKLVATSLTYPYIVLKSRMQAGSSEGQRYKSSLHGLFVIIEEEGITGLYKGIGTKLMQSVLNAAILFVSQRRIFEITRKALAPVTAT
ncbi:mitochondrial carrier domain-containing protein [Cytidiella melzeri]|nr:mitochondrial carrier domain-containing protein [Cytidiella melzeri]